MELALGAALIVGIVVGAVCGVLWYRYQLSNHPEKLAKWLRELDEAKGDPRSSMNRAIDSVALVGQRIEAEIDKATTAVTSRLKAELGEELIARLREAANKAEQRIRDAANRSK